MPSAPTKAPTQAPAKHPDPRQQPQIESERALNEPEVARLRRAPELSGLPQANGLPPVARGAVMLESAGLNTIGRARISRAIQRRAGNAFLGRSQASSLQVDPPDSPAEREAERTAERVMQMPDPTDNGGVSVQDQSDGKQIARACAACEAETVQRAPLAPIEKDSAADVERACAACDEDSIQRDGEDPTPAVTSETKQTIDSERGGGEPLPESTRAFFEPRFGRSFEDITVHHNAAAASAASDLSARAFTTGDSIFFGAGEYQPESSDGRKLIAHELTHTVQIGASDISRDPQPAGGVIGIVDTIVDALEGYTSGADSETIIAQFPDGQPDTIRAILQELKRRGPSQDPPLNDQGMINYLFDDLTAEDARTLRRRFIAARVVEDIRRMLVREILDGLEGYTSEDDSHAIYEILRLFNAAQLDGLLQELETTANKSQEEMGAWLFEDLDRVTAERVRTQFFGATSVKAGAYAIDWTTERIYSLLSGYTGITSSSQIVSNFRATPEPLQAFVYARLDGRSRSAWNQPAQDALMEDMQRADYEELRALLRTAGVTMDAYHGEPGIGEGLLTMLEWGLVLASWAVCGLVGIVTGILSVIGDFLQLLWDAGVAIVDLLGTVVYFLSGRTACSAQWLKVKEFFKGLGSAVSDPGKAWDAYWEETGLELRTIEGPFTDCRRAEFVVRRVVNGIVNILLIALAGYGAVKGVVSGAEAAATFARVVARVGAVRAARLLAGRAARWIGTLAKGTAAAVGRIATALRTPVATLRRLGTGITRLALAATDVRNWQALRGQATVLRDAEIAWWREQKAVWTERITGQSTRYTALEDEAAMLEASVGEGEVPTDPDRVVQTIADDSVALEGEVQRIEGQMTGPTLPRSYLDWEESLNPATRAALRENPQLQRIYGEMDPAVRRLLTLCESPCLPLNPPPTPRDVQRVKAIIDRLGLSDNDPFLREYFHGNTNELTAAIDAIEGATTVGELRMNAWTRHFKTRAAVGGANDPRRIYQIEKCGPTETQVVGGGQQIYADGVDAAAAELHDAKRIGDANQSPYVDGSSVDPAFRPILTADFEDELMRYAAVINDPATPVTSLVIITNEPRAVPYFQRMLQQYGCPGRVVVRP